MFWSIRILVFVGVAILLVACSVQPTQPPNTPGNGQYPIPEKAVLTYPNLGSHLDQLVAQVEAGEISAQEAAQETAIHQGGLVAVTVRLSGSVEEVVAFLEDNGGDPRNVANEYIEAYVPMSLLGRLSEQPNVLRVREILPPQPAK